LQLLIIILILVDEIEKLIVKTIICLIINLNYILKYLNFAKYVYFLLFIDVNDIRE
jgi:hypothetical protein